MKIAVVTPIPTPYRDPFWNVVSRQPGVDLHVFYCARRKADRPWLGDWGRQFAHTYLPGWNLTRWRGADASCYWNPGIGRRLRAGGYDAVLVGGYNHPTMLAAMRAARRMGTPYYVMCETYRGIGRGRWTGGIKERVVRRVFENAAGALPTGVLAERYVRECGAKAEGTLRLPNVPDVAALAEESRRSRENGAGGGASRPVVLFVGRLIPKKRAGLLIRAFQAAGGAERARLVLVGDGPDRAALERVTADLGLRGAVEFAGFCEPGEVRSWYGRASVYVLPSSETWGVSVIEALASGVPVIVSDEVGCHPDVMCEPGVGRVVRAGEMEGLVHALTDALASPISKTDVVRAMKPLLESLTYRVLAERLVSHLRGGGGGGLRAVSIEESAIPYGGAAETRGSSRVVVH